MFYLTYYESFILGPVLADPGIDCNKTCQSIGYTCLQAIQTFNSSEIFKKFGKTCSSDTSFSVKFEDYHPSFSLGRCEGYIMSSPKILCDVPDFNKYNKHQDIQRLCSCVGAGNVVECTIPKIKMLCNLHCLKARLKLLCNKYQWHGSLNLVLQQLKLCNIFIFEIAYYIPEFEIMQGYLCSKDLVKDPWTLWKSVYLILKNQTSIIYLS